MGLSVPRHIDRKGEHLSQCDVCGTMYLRSALRRGRDGLLRCEFDRPGRDAVTLAELTARRAAALAASAAARLPADGARPDTDSAGNPSSQSDYTGAIKRLTLDQAYDGGAVATYTDPHTRLGKPGF